MLYSKAPKHQSTEIGRVKMKNRHLWVEGKLEKIEEIGTIEQIFDDGTIFWKPGEVGYHAC